MPPYRRLALALIALLVSVLVFLAASVSHLIESGADLNKRPDEMGQFIPAQGSQPAPEIAFEDGAGNPVSLADFRGRLVLVNFWATWCGPCVEEMPSLDRLQAKLGSRRFEVVAVSQDRGGARVVQPFRDRLGLAALKAYFDPKGNFGRSFGIRGLPTSILIDRKGREIGRFEGAAEWDGAPALALIQRYLAASEGAGEKTEAAASPAG
jgi:thiol-disulfide isomerase/thioredoxin